MKAPQPSRGIRRLAREECAVGDWVEAADVPGWSQDVGSHDFLRERISISPWEGEKGGIVLSAKPDRWTFGARHFGGQLVWMREQ
jgi:hypothetical protein